MTGSEISDFASFILNPTEKNVNFFLLLVFSLLVIKQNSCSISCKAVNENSVTLLSYTGFFL
jgi:hypothetical protein